MPKGPQEAAAYGSAPTKSQRAAPTSIATAPLVGLHENAIRRNSLVSVGGVGVGVVVGVGVAMKKDLWEFITHSFGLCRVVHVGNLEVEARDCHACRKRLCPRCEKIFRERKVERERARANLK